MEALMVIDCQNEFSPEGKRPVANFAAAISSVLKQVDRARNEARPIAWIRHYNRPDEGPAFQPGSWGVAFYPGCGPKTEQSIEAEFHKDVYGAFTGTDVGHWLKRIGAESILLVGFYTHGCVSTTAREGIVRNLRVSVDGRATGSRDMKHDILGQQSADEVRRSALLHLESMGVHIV